jgi:hypothetical protein
MEVQSCSRKSRRGRARKLRVLAMLCIWLCIGSACVGVFAGGLLVLLMARLP